MLRIILIISFIFCLSCGCAKKSESPAVELTLPQVPKLPIAYKPTNKDIQIALQNAGYYKGKIDGDIGPLSKQAIKEFQEDNNLAVDAEAGPKTWALLSRYLSSPEKEGQ